MSVISTEHPDVKISNCITQGMRFADQAAHELHESDRPLFYWRLTLHSVAQIVAHPSSFCIPPGGDPKVSARVVQTISQFERLASIRFKGSPEQQLRFYKRLHRALAEHAYGLDATSMDLADTSFDGDAL